MPDITLQPQVPPGAPGTRVLLLPAFPLTPAFGNDGDWAIYRADPTRILLFGPKSNGQWPQQGFQLNGAPGAPGVGTTGQNAWSPLYAITADGARRVLTITDWVGGEGTKPTATPIFVSTTGLTQVLSNGADIRGTAGAGNGDVIGPVSATVGGLAVFGDTAGDTIRAPTAPE